MPAAIYSATTIGGVIPLRSTEIADAMEEATHLNCPDQTVDIVDADHNEIATCVDVDEGWLPHLPTNPRHELVLEVWRDHDRSLDRAKYA